MKNLIFKSRAFSFFIVIIIYVAAFFGGFFIFGLSGSLNPLIAFFLADIAATVIVWLAGIVLKNSSVYDPYWSVAPLVFIPAWIASAKEQFLLVDLLFIIAVFVWGLRLTVNWALRWKGLGQQDWRYTMLREKSPKMWFITNLVGINVMPTIFVYLSLIPAYCAITRDLSLNAPLQLLKDWQPQDMANLPAAIAGFVICIAAVAIQAIADRQMDNFKRDAHDKSKYIDSGLWRYSRHPNYFGEVLFWWGIWIIQMGFIPQLWITLIGPVSMTLLFLFISIPMMENHIAASKPGYITYRKKVSMLIPWMRSGRK